MSAGDQRTNGGQFGKPAPTSKCHSHPTDPPPSQAFLIFHNIPYSTWLTLYTPYPDTCKYTNCLSHTHTRRSHTFTFRRWICVDSSRWCTMHANHSVCQQTMERDPQQDTQWSPSRTPTWTYCVTLHNIHTRLGCLSSADRLVCKPQSLDYTHWLKAWRTCLGKEPSGFHMSVRNNSYCWLETKKGQCCKAQQLAEGLVTSRRKQRAL